MSPRPATSPANRKYHNGANEENVSTCNCGFSAMDFPFPAVPPNCLLFPREEGSSCLSSRRASEVL